MSRFAARLLLLVATALPPPLLSLAAEKDTADSASAILSESKSNYAAAAREVTQHIQTRFYLAESGLYAHSTKQRHPEFMWGNGVMFTALVGAARHESGEYVPAMAHYFHALDQHWDTRVPIPGYEPSTTQGGGHDKYYDDNAWMVLTYTEAYEVTQDRQYLDRAEQTLAFVLSGWDEQRGGGIWWHEGHRDGSKNTCVNAPAAVACLRMAEYLPPEKSKAAIAMAKRIVEWTTTNLELQDGLYADAINVETGAIHRAKLTYNTALMIRAFLGLYRHTGDETYLHKAQRAATASDWFLDRQTHAFRDSVKWSHLLVEADLEMFRATHEEYLLRRAMNNADQEYATWKANPPAELIDNASVARTLWLMVDMQSPAGRQFWQRVDQRRAPS